MQICIKEEKEERKTKRNKYIKYISDVYNRDMTYGTLRVS